MSNLSDVKLMDLKEELSAQFGTELELVDFDAIKKEDCAASRLKEKLTNEQLVNAAIARSHTSQIIEKLPREYCFVPPKRKCSSQPWSRNYRRNKF